MCYSVVITNKPF